MRSVSAEGSGAFHHDQDGTLVLSLQNCIELALQRNPLVVATGRAIEASEAQLMEAKAVPWPVLEYRYRTAPVPTDVDNALKTFFEGQVTFFNSLYLAVGIPVTTFGQLRTAQSMAKGGVEAARLNKTKEQESTIAQIKKMYYGLQLAADMKDLLKTTIGELNKRVDQEEKKDIPDESPLALLRLKALALELETRQAEVEQNEALAMQGMRIQLDLPEDVRFRLDEERLKPLLVNFSSLEKFTEASSANRPDFQLLDIGIATKQKLYKLEKLKLMPKAGIGAFFEIGGTTSTVSGVQATDDFNNPFNYKRAGLGFQVEGKFDFHGAAARIRKAKAEYLEVSQKRSIAKRGLNLETQQAFLNAKRQFENMQRARKAHSLARQMLFLARSNLDIGLGEKDDYLDALKRTLVSRGEYLKATFDANVATADLSRLVGQAATGELMPPMSAAEYDLINEEDSGEESWNENDTSE